MFITKNRTAAAHVPARRGRGGRAAAARRDGAGVDRRWRGRRRVRATRFGAIYIPNGAIMEQWIPDVVGAGFDIQADPQAARAVQGSAGRRHPT